MTLGSWYDQQVRKRAFTLSIDPTEEHLLVSCQAAMSEDQEWGGPSVFDASLADSDSEFAGSERPPHGF